MFNIINGTIIISDVCMYHRKIEVQFLYLVHAGPNLMDSNPIHATSRYTTVQVCILLPIALALRPYQI